MALRNIMKQGDPLLHKRSREVAEITPRTLELIDDMWETMYDANGVGLAAPQVGVLRRIAVVDATPAEDEEGGAETNPETIPPPVYKHLLINPEIVWASDETEDAKEGCLSVPNMVGMVRRPLKVRVRTMGLDGGSHEIEADGLLAKAFSHEIDHLNGILYTDIAEWVEEAKESEDE